MIATSYRYIVQRAGFRDGQVTFLLMAVLPLSALCACFPQKSLAHRLAGADRVSVTNALDGLSISLTGGEVRKVVEAIGSAKKESPLTEAAAGLRLEFYRGAQHLGTVITAYEIFAIDQKPYRDTTGTLRDVYERYRDEHPSRTR